MRFSFVFCFVLFAAIVSGGENAPPLDSTKLQIGWLTKDGAFPTDFAASATFPRIVLEPLKLQDITLQDKKLNLKLIGRVDDPAEGILATPFLQEVRLMRGGTLCGTLPLTIVKDPPSEFAPHARHYTFSGTLQVVPDDELIELTLVTPLNSLGAAGIVSIGVHTNKDKEFALSGVDTFHKPLPETVWSPFMILIRAPAGTDEKALLRLAEWKHCGRAVKLIKRPNQTDAAKTGSVDFVSAAADGSPQILVQPWDVSPPVLGFGNANAKAERIYTGEVEATANKESGGAKRKIRIRAVIHDAAQTQGIKAAVKVVVKHNGLDWDGTFPDVPGDAGGKFPPRVSFGTEWEGIESGTYEGTLTLVENQLPAANFGGIRK